jgi:hypothetical protein
MQFDTEADKRVVKKKDICKAKPSITQELLSPPIIRVHKNNNNLSHRPYKAQSLSQ